MKKHFLPAAILILSVLVASCEKATPMAAPPLPAATASIMEFPTASGLTPASLDPVIGDPQPTVAIDNNWRSYQDVELGISLNYPSNWQALALNGSSGLGLYPPGSEPGTPTPMIKIRWLKVPYSSSQPLVQTEGPVDPITLAGVTGRQYQDSEFAIPTQSHYIELPYRDGILFFVTTQGPSVDLTPQLREILKTFVLIDELAATEAPDNTADSHVFEVTVSAAQGWQDTHIQIQSGTRVTVEVIAGQWTQRQGVEPYNAGDGGDYVCASFTSASQCVEPVPDFPQGALIGRIGEEAFSIGSRGVISLQESGNLFLRINDGDDGLFDNDGELTVRITLSD